MFDQIFYTQGINLIFSEKRTRSNLLKSAQGPRRPYFYWSIRDGASLSKAPLRNGEIRSFSSRLLLLITIHTAILSSCSVLSPKTTMATRPVADSHSNRAAVQATNDDASASKLYASILLFYLSYISRCLVAEKTKKLKIKENITRHLSSLFSSQVLC
jgi:hypothetical protein